MPKHCAESGRVSLSIIRTKFNKDNLWIIRNAIDLYFHFCFKFAYLSLSEGI